jgi:hypothetical protein
VHKLRQVDPVVVLTDYNHFHLKAHLAKKTLAFLGLQFSYLFRVAIL